MTQAQQTTKPSGFLSRRALAVTASVVVLAGVGAWSATSRAAKPPAPAAPPAQVSVAPVLQRTVTQWDSFSGRVEAIDNVQIRPRVSGTIDTVHFQEGQLVKKGDLLFTIDQRPFQAELARTEAAAAAARARLAFAKTDLERTRGLIGQGFTTRRELDQRDNGLLEAQANLQAADAAVQSARLNLQYSQITAPVAGRVSRAEITVGNLVGTSPAEPALTSIVSVSPVYVSFEIDEPTYIRYASNGAAGNSGVEHMPVSVGLTNEEGYPHAGKVKAIDNRVDVSSGTIRVRAVLDNKDGLLTPGMFARVRTGGSAAAVATLIDDKAVGTDQNKNYVMVVDAQDKANYRAVQLGPFVDGLRVVRSGLNKDERIVVAGLQRVRPNDKVAPVAVEMDRTKTAAQ